MKNLRSIKNFDSKLNSEALVLKTVTGGRADLSWDKSFEASATPVIGGGSVSDESHFDTCFD